MINFGHNLGRHISRSPTESIDCIRRHRVNTESEIDQLYLLVSVDQNVFSLYVPVHNIPVVHVLQSLRDDQQELLGFILFQSMFMF